MINIFSEDVLYPLIGATAAVMVYFFLFHEKKKTTKEQSEIDQLLMDAAQAGELEECKRAIEEGAELPSGPEFIDKCGKKTALHTAAQYGQNDVIDWLVLEKDVPVDLPDWAKMRPLHYGAMKGRTKTCKMLLQMKADPMQADSARYSCVHFAASGGFEETLEVLKAGGADMNGRDQGGFTPLMLASCKGKASAVEWLLQNGADKFAMNSAEATAYDLALQRKHKAVTNILEGKPAKVTTQAMRMEAERIINEKMEESLRKAEENPEQASEATLRERKKRDKQDKKAKLKSEVEAKALEMAKDKASGKAKAKKQAKKLTEAGIGSFQGDFDPKQVKENFPEAWEAARAEVAEMCGGDANAIESLLDTVE